MKKTTALILSLTFAVGMASTMNTTHALSWAQKRANTNELNEAIQTKQNNYFKNIKRSEMNLKNVNVLKDYHNKNIWENFVTRRSTELNRTGEMQNNEGVRTNNGYVAAANNAKMTMKKGWLCYLIRNEAPGEGCYTMGQIDGEETGRISTRAIRMNAADVAAINSAVRDINKAAMYSEINENTKDRTSTFAPNSSQRYFTSPSQKKFTVNPDDLDL